MWYLCFSDTQHDTYAGAVQISLFSGIFFMWLWPFLSTRAFIPYTVGQVGDAYTEIKEKDPNEWLSKSLKEPG